MNNDSKIPAGWSMPDDMANRISKIVNIKTFSTEDDLKEAIDDLRQVIALAFAQLLK
jgi:hypothetical protein